MSIVFVDLIAFFCYYIIKGGDNLKERIKELREQLGLTQQKFADKIGLKRQTIAAYEIGKIEPSDSTLLLLCKEFNVNEEWIRTGTGNMFKELTRNQEIQSFANEIMELPDKDIKKKLVLAISKLTPQDWENLIICAEKILKEVEGDD